MMLRCLSSNVPAGWWESACGRVSRARVRVGSTERLTQDERRRTKMPALSAGDGGKCTRHIFNTRHEEGRKPPRAEGWTQEVRMSRAPSRRAGRPRALGRCA